MNVLAHLNSANFATRLGLFVMPVAYNWLWNRTRIHPEFNSLEFMNWAI